MKNFTLKLFLVVVVCFFYHNTFAQWQPMGNQGLVASNAADHAIATDASGTTYVAYRNEANGYKATVKKFDGKNWVTVGKDGFSIGYAKDLSLAIDPKGTPYVAYTDNGNLAKAVVKKFNGSTWVEVGTTNFTIDYAFGIELAIDTKGVAYVAFQNTSNNGKATVKKFIDSKWENVGGTTLSKCYANGITLAIDKKDTPYVGYTDEQLGGKATVRKFDGNNWVDVGDEGFSKFYVTGLSLAIDNKNTPYVVYRDEAVGYKATVQQFNGSKWVEVGTAGFSAGVVNHTAISISSKGVPYVTYVDYGKGAANSIGTTRLSIFTNNKWENVSPTGLSAKREHALALTLDKEDNAYLLNSGEATGWKATVSKFKVPVKPNEIPLANAGTDQTITLPINSVSLQGSGTDTDGTIASYNWKQVSGPGTATFSNDALASPTVSNLQEGTYIFSLTVTDNQKATSATTQVSVSVKPLPVVIQQVLSYTLINADNGKEIMTIKNGAELNLATLPTKKLNIRVNTNMIVGSLKLALSGKLNKDVIENLAPYALFGGSATKYNAWTPGTGNYTLTATPYTAAGCKGKTGSPLTINFKVINQSATATNPKLSAARTEQEVTAEVTTTKSVSVYPNPAVDKLHVEVSEAGKGETTLQLLDMNGNIALTQKVITTNSLNVVLNVDQLQGGVYSLNINTPQGRITRRVIIK